MHLFERLSLPRGMGNSLARREGEGPGAPRLPRVSPGGRQGAGGPCPACREAVAKEPPAPPGAGWKGKKAPPRRWPLGHNCFALRGPEQRGDGAGEPPRPGTAQPRRGARARRRQRAAPVKSLYNPPSLLFAPSSLLPRPANIHFNTQTPWRATCVSTGIHCEPLKGGAGVAVIYGWLAWHFHYKAPRSQVFYEASLENTLQVKLCVQASPIDVVPEQL